METGTYPVQLKCVFVCIYECIDLYACLCVFVMFTFLAICRYLLYVFMFVCVPAYMSVM